MLGQTLEQVGLMGCGVSVGNSPSLTLNYPAVVNPALNSAFHHLPSISCSVILCKEKKDVNVSILHKKNKEMKLQN